MFEENKYSKIYFSLVKKNSKINNANYERHHIIPRSFGGKDTEENISYLTPREHFIAHMLLIRMTNDVELKNKMRFALHRMSHNPHSSIKNNSRFYEIARLENIKALKSKIVSDETREKMSRAQKGLKKSKQHREKLSKIASLRIGEKNPFYGKEHSVETKTKISKANSGRLWYNNGITSKNFKSIDEVPEGWLPGRLSGGFNTLKKKKCPNCNIEVVPANYNRHYNKCLSNLSSDSSVSSN